MKLKRFITDKEMTKLKGVMENENLRSDKAYSKIFKEDLNIKDAEQFAFVEDILKEIIEEFSIFKAVVEQNRVRFEYNYNYGTDNCLFNGVGYKILKKLQYLNLIYH